MPFSRRFFPEQPIQLALGQRAILRVTQMPLLKQGSAVILAEICRAECFLLPLQVRSKPKPWRRDGL